MALNSSPRIPNDLIAALVPGEGTVCRVCIEKTPAVLDGEDVTPIFNYDEWYSGDVCCRCHKPAR